MQQCAVVMKGLAGLIFNPISDHDHLPEPNLKCSTRTRSKDCRGDDVAASNLQSSSPNSEVSSVTFTLCEPSMLPIPQQNLYKPFNSKNS